jgi:hypothetical protein
MSRLNLVSAELAATVAAGTDAQLRRAILAGARLAAARTHLSDPRADQAMSALADGVTGSPEERGAIQRLTEELDNVAFDLQDQMETGEATHEQYEEAFLRARAASALDFAFEEDTAHAASESLYEAYHAIDDLPALLKVVDEAFA